MKSYLDRGHVIIENVTPQIDCGRHRPKAVGGDQVVVGADIFRDGTDVLRAVVRHKGPSDARWIETPMFPVSSDRWEAAIRVSGLGTCRYTIEAWTDPFATWRRDLIKRVEAGQDVDLELEEGARIVHEALRAIPARRRAAVEKKLAAIRSGEHARGHAGDIDTRIEAALDEDLFELMARHQARHGLERYQPTLELTVDRERARYGAWYEFFPRSTGTKGAHGTFESASKELHRIADMGFDVVYLPPIHPIGTSHRKGKNNSLVAGTEDVGVPWAIGGQAGGHTAVHPDLGTIDDFDAFVKQAAELELEVALDFAIQCSPDHPWVKEHPEWFHHRPDGSIKHAENPPKKYQDVYPVNFDTENREELWRALKGIVDFWIDHGVKIFRVDNPHTKPFPFWEWLIETVHRDHPDVVFLAEAFTRPKVMQSLAKLGFSQSYTYFTWRNAKGELIEYLTELAHTDMVDYFRPNFFVNTPDILHEFLQIGGPPAFRIRLILAAMLSPSYGVYSGYELFENTPRDPGSEEYLNSEKYQLTPRDWSVEPNLIPLITRLNEIRREFTSLHRLDNLRWHNADKDRMLAFSKKVGSEDGILVVINLNPFHWEEATLEVDLDALGLDGDEHYEVQDLISGDRYTWAGPFNYVRLDPREEVAHIFRVSG